MVACASIQMGTFSYQPAPNFNGEDSFTYTVSDGSLLSKVATVKLTVRPKNDAPILLDQDLNGQEDQVLQGNLLLSASDVDSDELTATLLTRPAHGILVVNSDGSFSYTPEANFNGSDSFTYQVSDGELSSAVATIRLNVKAENDAPQTTDVEFTLAEDVKLLGSLLATDVDNNASELRFVIIQPAATRGATSKTPTVHLATRQKQIILVTDSFTYRVNDGNLDSNLATGEYQRHTSQ